MDPLSAAADEVTLEGLDGITIPSLWIRLEDRRPKFPLKLDDCTKELIWRFLVSNSELKFYQLPHEREDVQLWDRFKEIDPETGIGTTSTLAGKQKDIYPVHIVGDNKDGIQGSCSVFKERIDITKHVRSKSLTALVTLKEALERYGRKLVVVASNSLRFRALIGEESDPDLKLNNESFCLLEKVGRARWQGELQSELHRFSFKTDARKLHYMRKSLVKHGLVTMQSHVTRAKLGQQQQHSILLLLKRFHVNRKSKYDILMEQVSNLLLQLPGQITTMFAIRDYLNVTERTFKRVFLYMRTAKLVESCKIPLEELDPDSKHCTTKKGKKVHVRCVKLLKPYSKKCIAYDDPDDDEYDEDDSGTRRTAFPPCGRIMERDVLSQGYQIVLSCGTKGLSMSGIGHIMNIGKLESRMVCRRLERDGAIQGFMEDEGRQRTTKFISHKCVDVSDQLQLFAKEKERTMLLISSAPETSDAAAAASETPPPPSSRSRGRGNTKTKTNQKAGGGDEDTKEAGQTCGDGDVEMSSRGLRRGRGKARGKSRAGRKSKRKEGSVTEKQMQPDDPKIPPTAECETTECSESKTSTTPDIVIPEPVVMEVEEEQSNVTSVPPVAETEASPNTPEGIQVEVLKDHHPKKAFIQAKSQHVKHKLHETYRLLKRKNLIVEEVRSCKIIEGLFPLQKMINEAEKLEGVSSKCCKKTILRLIHCLAKEGLLKLYTTTVIQDGVSKKVQMVVHPSIQPSDDIVQRVIEQVRFKISNCYSARQQEEKTKEQESRSNSVGSLSKKQKTKANKNKEDKSFKPTTVPGLGKSFGFQPKMHRLRIVHYFLWHLIYGHPLRHNPANYLPTGETSASIHTSDAEAKHTDNQDEQDHTTDTQDGTIVQETTQSLENADSVESKLDLASGDEEEEQKVELPGCSPSDMTVYADEDTWKRFVPPVRVHKEFSSGWARLGDLLHCLPLSVFIQVIQINYKVDGLEEYLNDPVKQHMLVRVLPAKMRRQLFYKRKYLFSFHDNLQKLVYMGLLQLGPAAKFMEKDQVFLYLKQNATIVDTTSAEPHYWLITELPDKPFERRKYTFNTSEDVENYWFDLMCVCLNTPLGVIRTKKNVTDDDSAPSFVQERYVFVGLSYLLKGSREVVDDGSIPGDSKGAAGLHSEFFAHLKRNWFWTNHLLTVKANPSVFESRENKIRLKSLLSKNALRLAFNAGATTKPKCLTSKLPLVAENIEVGIEPASRNQQVVGGKKQKRKRTKKEVVKVPRKKKKEPRKRKTAHDEADHQALKNMTRQRVYWTAQEDSLMMLCSVASHLLNSKLKRSFVPYCVVRDLLHSEFANSVDKTSVAVGRRTRYILKNPQTLLNYRICLAEVYQDKALMKLVEEKKPADPNNLEVCSAAFSEYTKLLRQKFSSVMSMSDINMADTKQELFSRFKVSAIDVAKTVMGKDSVKCIDDIHTIVLENLIQSTLAMTNSQMKSSRSFQTFHMYSKYSQELLCQVFIQCRKSGLVNRRRVNQPFGPKKNRALPILPMSYQLSQSYYRCFSWRFPHELCTESFQFLKGLTNKGTGDNRPLIVFHHETQNRSENGEVVLDQQKGSKRKETPSDVQAASVTESEPEPQAKETNTESAKESGTEQRQEEREEKLMEVDKTEEEKNPDDNLPAGSGDEASSREQTDDHLPKEKPSEEAAAADKASGDSKDPPQFSDMLELSMDSVGGACVVSLSLMTLGLLNVNISIPKQMVVVDSSLVDSDVVKSMATLDEDDDNDEDDGEECEGTKKMEVKAHQASHTKYLMMRGFCCPGIVKVRKINTNDSIVVESCIMNLQLRDTPAHHIFGIENSPPLDLSKCGPSLIPSVLTFSTSSSSPSHSVEECDRSLIEHRGYTPQDTEACADLRRSLVEAGEIGLDVHDLYEAHAHQVKPQSGRTRSLLQYIQDLCEEGQVIKVGALGARYVLLQHAEPWLLTVNPKQWSQSQATPDRLEFLNNPSVRKRLRHEGQQETEEPPAKRAAVDKQESNDGEEAEGSEPTRGTLDEEEQMKTQQERSDEGSREKQMTLEEMDQGEQTQHEDGGEAEAGQEAMETEEPQAEKRQLRSSNCGKDDTNVEEALGISDIDENLSFISRPWRLVDGKLNRLVCKGMLEALLYQIMSRPGVTQQALVEHYRNVLQPMAVMDLLQALLEIGCVVEKTLVKPPKPSLFSRPVNPKNCDTEEKPMEPDCVFYEPTISCCLRLSQLLPNERHWNCCLP